MCSLTWRSQTLYYWNLMEASSHRQPPAPTLSLWWSGLIQETLRSCLIRTKDTSITQEIPRVLGAVLWPETNIYFLFSHRTPLKYLVPINCPILTFNNITKSYPQNALEYVAKGLRDLRVHPTWCVRLSGQGSIKTDWNKPVRFSMTSCSSGFTNCQLNLCWMMLALLSGSCQVVLSWIQLSQYQSCVSRSHS